MILLQIESYTVAIKNKSMQIHWGSSISDRTIMFQLWLTDLMIYQRPMLGFLSTHFFVRRNLLNWNIGISQLNWDEYIHDGTIIMYT